MEKTRYFRSGNKLNDFVNFFSGNNFPVSDENTSRRFLSRIYLLFTWCIKITYFTTGVLGSVYLENRSAALIFEIYGAIGVLSIEVLITSIYFSTRSKDLRSLIAEYNDILIDSEELKKHLRELVEPYQKRAKVFIAVGFGAAVSWSASPFLFISKKEEFTCADLAVAACLSPKPFGAKLFAAGIILQCFGAWYFSFTKTCTDIYVCNLVMMLTAQYRYVRSEIGKALSLDNEGMDQTEIVDGLKKCIRHHCSVIKTGRLLIDILGFHIGLAYIVCIMKFCFIAYGVAVFENNLINTVSWIMYGFSCVGQAFLVCSSTQDLLDASTSVVDDAFHENWHARGLTIKKIFYTIQLSTQIECRLNSFRMVDLLVPTMAAILSKSYSIFLILLEAQ